MSWIDTHITLESNGNISVIKDPLAVYQPKDVEKERLMMIRQDFTDGDVVLKRPRREFNDLSMLERMAIDQMAFAVYQPNDGDPLEGDQVNGWRSNAVRPIVRNKIISITAHINARTIYPKIMAFNHESEEEADASTVMSDLMEWSITGTNATYADVSLASSISALVNPISWVHTQYQETYRLAKKGKNEDGSWKTENILDEDNSGFIDEAVPPDQMYFGEFYIRNGDVQLQPWLIRRKVINYSSARTLFGKYPNFVHVKPGIQVIYNDANQQFYEVYDVDMRQNEVEVVYYWNKALDLYLIAVNGVLLTDPDNPNPREDKLYPFACYGYELLRPAGDCMAYKSLAFKTMPDDKIVNTLYPMIIDGTYLNLFPPTVAIGVETIGSDVIIPGMTTTFASNDADLKPILAANENLKAGFDALFKVEQNIMESSIDTQEAAKPENSGDTAYQISKAEQHASIILGLFLSMQARYVKQMGRLRIGDIKQKLTLPQVMAIEGSAESELVYKTFLMGEGKGRNKSRKIEFSLDVPEDTISKEQHLSNSYDIFEQEGGENAKYKLYKTNPRLFRNLKYLVIVAPDVMAPLSDELERAYNLEEFDRMIKMPQVFDPEETGRLLLESYTTTKKNPDKYLAKNPQPSPMQPGMQGQGMTPMNSGKNLSPAPMTQGLPPMPGMGQ